MSRLSDILYFLRQIFFPNWKDRDDDTEPSGLQKIIAAIVLFFASRDGAGTLFSIVLHVFVLVALSLIMIPKLGDITGIDILGGMNIPGIEPEQANVELPQTTDEGDAEAADDRQQMAEEQPAEIQNPTEEQSPLPEQGDNPENVETQQPLVPSVGSIQGGFVSGGGFQNRTADGRNRAMQNGDSSQRGENAVEAALEWFAAHQQADGGWSFDFEDSCKRCSHSGTGTLNRRTAATALALLSYFGAGYTHQIEGRYQSVIEKGLLFLIRDPNGGIDGRAIQQDPLRMYSYGLAAMALCEAYAMNKEQDPMSQLGVSAQKSLLLIEMAQDIESGGWRYRAGMSPGDTSVFAWQLMALKSGKIGGLQVSQSVLYAAQDFLDSVALEGGRNYQYLPTGEWDAIRGDDSPKTCTAIGLLMRMYLGWKPGDVFLDDGMQQIVRWGYMPNELRCNLYYAYYSTLALHHYGGEHWEQWNSGLRELLISSQSHEDCESGSWYFPDAFCDSGGRHLNTALAVMILETPYRIMPLYREVTALAK